MQYTVTGTIQSRDESNLPVEVKWYKGPDLAQAISALVQSAAHHIDLDSTLPVHMQYRTLNVHMDMTEDGR